LHFILNSKFYDVIIITETWLSNKISDSLILSHNFYSIFRCDRNKGKGGGVCIILANYISYQKIQCTKIPNSNIVAVDIISPNNNKKIRIINLYRPTTTETESHFTALFDLISDLCTIQYPIILTGDFNFPNIN
jgi:exonuclease III